MDIINDPLFVFLSFLLLGLFVWAVIKDFKK